MAKVTIGCKLPHGLILQHPANPDRKVRLNGLKDSKIIGATFITTEIDAEFWAIWKKSYSDFQPLKTGAVFEASNQAEADAIGKELEGEKTGLEPLSPSAHGVKPVTKD